jgi:hypothetical protein
MLPRSCSRFIGEIALHKYIALRKAKLLVRFFCDPMKLLTESLRCGYYDCTNKHAPEDADVFNQQWRINTELPRVGLYCLPNAEII